MHVQSDYLGLGMENLDIIKGSYQIEIVHEFLSSSEMTGYLIWPAIKWNKIHVGIGRNISTFIMTYTETFYPGIVLITFGTLHTSMESTYPHHIPNLTYIKYDNSFLWKNSITAGLIPDNWRSQTNAEYTSKFTPYPKCPMGKATTLKNGTIMATKMNYINPPTNGLIKDNQVQKNVDGGLRRQENAPQVIITQPIFTN